MLAAALADASSLPELIDSEILDLFLVAALELAPTDAEVRAVAADAAAQLDSAFGDWFPVGDISAAASIFAARLLRRALSERTTSWQSCQSTVRTSSSQ